MRVDPDTCRDPDLLAAEVRRLRGVIAASQPTLTDDEREALESPAESSTPTMDRFPSGASATLLALLVRLGGERCVARFAIRS
jgi:hypothetical protein